MSDPGSGKGPDSGTRAGRGVLDPTGLIEALADEKIEYVLVGGLAVAAHGYPRATGDLDICPNPSEENLVRLVGFLESVEARSLDEGEFDADELAAHDLEGLRGGGNFRLRTRLGKLDVMQYLEPFGERTWEVLDAHAEQRAVSGQPIRICGYRDLLAMKQAAGRDQDKIDIANIKAARREL